MENSMSWTAIIVAAIALLSNVVPLFVQARKDKNINLAEVQKKVEEAEQIKAETDKEQVNTALSLVTPLKQRITELEIELKAVITELRSIETLLIAKDNRILELERKEQELCNEIDGLTLRVRELENCVDFLKEENTRLKLERNS